MNTRVLMIRLQKVENIPEKLIIPLVLIVVGNALAGLVGHWPLDEASGTIAHDVSGNGNKGVFNGEPKWIAGIKGGALEFDGDDYIDCGNDTSLNFNGPISISVWIRPGADETQQVAPLCKANSGPAGWSWQLRYGWSSPKPYMGFVFNGTSGRVWIYVNQNLILRKWCHIVASYNGSTVKCYLNGKETDSADMRGLVNGSSSLLIGQDGWYDGWIGAIDDVRIYDHGLYQVEIEQLYSHDEKSPVSPMLLKLTDELHKARSIAEKQGSQKAIVFLEKKIAEYERWKQANPSEVKVRDELLFSELNFLLAKSGEAADAPKNKVAEAYKQSILRPSFGRHYVPALLWLFKNTSTSVYTDVVKKSMRYSSGARNNLHHIAKDFESSQNWAAFKLFLDAAFDEAGQPVSCAKAIETGLRNNGLWIDNFLGYARSTPQLTQYVIATYEEHAREMISQNKFLRAAEIYREIADQCGSEKDKAGYKLKALECIFNNGEYRRVCSEVGDFTRNIEFTDEVLAGKAILLTAHAYMHLNEIDHAIAAFSKLTTDHPDSEQAQEANFFIGYCTMLKGEYDKATKILNSVIRDCPRSSYANKARLCLTRIIKE
jgi:tetratricopeptide (TPR) repeat protein